MSFDPFGAFRQAGARRGASAPRAPQQPATPQRVPWHRRRAWTRAGRQLLRWYSKRSDFSLRVVPGREAPLACVDPARKRVEIAAAFPEPGEHADFDLRRASGHYANTPTQESIRGHEMLSGRPTELWLRGLIAHEAGHILFSGAKPEQKILGWLWNALEDERMERQVATRYDRLGPIFACMGDVMLTETDEERRRRHERQHAAAEREARGEPPATEDVMSACLLWRWLSGHTDAGRPGYHPYIPLPKAAFTGRLRPLVEAAWEADTSDEVTQVAREILAAFDLPEDAEVPEGLDTFDLPSGVSPSGSSHQDDIDDASSQHGGCTDGNAGSSEPAEGDSSDEDAPATDGTGGKEDTGADENPSDAESTTGREPDVPAVDPGSDVSQAAAALLDSQEAAARVLAEALRPERRSRLRRPHRSRGRFAYGRYARGAERPFTRRPERAEPPAFLTVLLDVSGSMAGQGLFAAAKRCVALLSAAAEIAGTDLRVIPFCEEAAPPLSTRGGAGHETIRCALAALHAGGNTQLAPALRCGLEEAFAGSGAHVVVLISDGQLPERDAERCEQLYRRARRRPPAPLVLPLLLGAAAGDTGGGKAVYERIFGRYAALGNASELSEVARRWLRHAA